MTISKKMIEKNDKLGIKTMQYLLLLDPNQAESTLSLKTRKPREQHPQYST